MDKELFELCKEVYEITEWETERFYWSDTRNPDKYIESLRKLQIIDYKPRWLNGKDNEDKHVVPLYTSDYLLEKLPNTSYQMDVTSAGVKLTSFYTDEKWETVHSDTPLKALLKLTLALHKAGELNG